MARYRNPILQGITSSEDYANELAQNGMKPIGSNNQGSNSQQNKFQRMLAMLSAKQSTDPRTMGGFALGKLLRELFDNWKANYQERGRVKAERQLKAQEDFMNQYGNTVGDILQNPQSRTALNTAKNFPNNAGGDDSAPQITPNQPSTNEIANQYLPVKDFLDSGDLAKVANQYDFQDISRYPLNKFGAPDFSMGWQNVNQPFNYEDLLRQLGR